VLRDQSLLSVLGGSLGEGVVGVSDLSVRGVDVTVRIVAVVGSSEEGGVVELVGFFDGEKKKRGQLGRGGARKREGERLR